MQPISLARPYLLNAIWAMHDVKGFLDDNDIAQLSTLFGVSAVEIEGVVSFYHFFHRQPSGKHTIYLNNSIVSEFSGFEEVKRAFEKETGAALGKVDATGNFGFYETSCIGLSDQEPAALIDFYPFTELTPQKVKHIVSKLKTGSTAAAICDMPKDHIRYTPPDDRAFIFRDFEPGRAIKKLVDLEPAEVFNLIKEAGLMGMGGAFFPTGLKWELCRRNHSNRKFVVCNADEGEPGTFKDRVLLNHEPGLVIEGMILGAYAVGASEGKIYLRAEYRYLKDKIEATIEDFRQRGLLGDDLPAKRPFSFDIKVQLGAGAYVCGEETALLNSMEGLRGEPRTKLYFPVERGYLSKPTIVNNVETFACTARIIELGPQAMLRLGTKESPGTKLISVSGDCERPGVYEIEWGMKLGDFLDLVGAQDPYFIQVSGPSGTSVSMKERERRISREDLTCGGSFMVFNKNRDVLQILMNFSNFFKHESCGICTPCRAGNFIMNRKLQKIQIGLGALRDLMDLEDWGKTLKQASRCGLGQMSPNSIVDAIHKFPEYFDSRVDKSGSRLNHGFDMERAVREYEEAVKE
ncbi:MAG: NAD(P)H-dependent oxidoreductase subunit E [Saprospiraceae bacterium]|nr:NAD(P)H-dependent oxidoreductase subunit E [Saprospiraceae bacterium]